MATGGQRLLCPWRPLLARASTVQVSLLGAARSMPGCREAHHRPGARSQFLASVVPRVIFSAATGLEDNAIAQVQAQVRSECLAR